MNAIDNAVAQSMGRTVALLFSSLKQPCTHLPVRLRLRFTGELAGEFVMSFHKHERALSEASIETDAIFHWCMSAGDAAEFARGTYRLTDAVKRGALHFEMNGALGERRLRQLFELLGTSRARAR